MGTLRLTNAQWTAVQQYADRPKVTRVFRKVNLGEPAGVDANGLPTDTPTHWLFDDPRIGGDWRVRVSAGPTVHFQEWADGQQVRELTLREVIEAFGGVF